MVTGKKEKDGISTGRTRKDGKFIKAKGFSIGDLPLLVSVLLLSLFGEEEGEEILKSFTESAGSVLGALIHIWRPEITDGCDISCLWI